MPFVWIVATFGMVEDLIGAVVLVVVQLEDMNSELFYIN
jgi:hypothetical protein